MKSIKSSCPAVSVAFKTDFKPNSDLAFDSHTHGVVPCLTSAARARLEEKHKTSLSVRGHPRTMDLIQGGVSVTGSKK